MNRALPLALDLASSHWGAYRVVRDGDTAVGLAPSPEDPDPSPIGTAMWEAYRSPIRVQRPAVREGWLAGGAARRGEGRGRE
jgi:biotin/methionine sulfoxide reductase